MEPQVWAVTAARLLLGAGFGWGIGRFLSRGLLVLIWITLAIGLAWCLYPALQNWMGRPLAGSGTWVTPLGSAPFAAIRASRQEPMQSASAG